MPPSTTANDDFDDELLSAYVDDELTAAQRARVEARLKTDPRAAALVEELRELSGVVRMLPQEKLPGDLRAAVLAKVRREGEAAPATIPMPTNSERWAARRRGLVWSAIAIAAALILSISQPPVDDEDEVAKRSANVVDGEKSASEPKREQFDSPADADRPVRFHQQSPSMSAPPEPASPAAAPSRPTPGAVADSEARNDDVGVGGGGGFAGGIGGEVDGAKLDSFAADEAAQGSAMFRSRELAAPATAPATARVDEDSAESSLSPSEPAEAPRVVDGRAGREESLAVERATGGSAAAPVGKQLQKSVAPPRVVEITMARGDAVSRFKQLLGAKKIAMGVDKTSTAATFEKLNGKFKAAPAEEILVNATPAQIEQLIFSCRADKAFAKVMPNGERRPEEFFAGAAPARGFGNASSPSSTTEAKAPASATLTAESNQQLATVLGANKDGANKSPEPSPYAYGVPAAAASPSSAAPPAAPGSGQMVAADASGAPRVQVLFRFLPIQAPATDAAK